MRHETLDDAPVHTYGGFRVRWDRYDLDGFAPYKATLTTHHRSWINQICRSIIRTFEEGRPRIYIRVEGHAAQLTKTPKKPPEEVATARAEAIFQALGDALASKGFRHRVEMVPPTSKSTRAQIEGGSEARNRRVVVTAFEADPRDEPIRWTCKLTVHFSETVHSPFNLNKTARKGVHAGHGSGLLISDRHVLTAAHVVTGLKRQGPSLTWVRPSRITITPGQRQRSNGESWAPLGTWSAKPTGIKVPNAFTPGVSLADYTGGLPDGPLRRQLWENDLAIVEIKPKRGRLIGNSKVAGGKMDWWSRRGGNKLGFGRFKWFIDELRNAKDGNKTWPSKCLGYPDYQPEYSWGDSEIVDSALVSQDMHLSLGHSGAPYWMDFGHKRYLVGVHHGDVEVDIWAGSGGARTLETGLRVEGATLLTPKHVRWINRNR